MNIAEMLEKLNQLYDQEEKIGLALIKLHKEYKQLQEDKELLQQLIMHQSNKKYRWQKK